MTEEDIPFPPVLSGEESKNNYDLGPMEAEKLPYIRASALNVLRDCPMQFHEKFVEAKEQPKRDGPDYALIGTIMHEVIESYLIHKWELNSNFAIRIQQAMLARDIRQSEVVKLGDYLNRIRQYRENTFKIEHEFNYRICEDFPPIKGHIDWVVRTGRKSIMVIDHKTNRKPKQLDKWKEDLQPMCYSWAMHRLLGADWDISFKIGYILLPYDADWKIHPASNRTFQTWFIHAWMDFLKQEREGVVKRTGCETCKYCPQSGFCRAERKGREVDTLLLEKTIEILHASH